MPGFLAEAADRLHQEAQGWFDSGLPLRAKKIWLEAVAAIGERLTAGSSHVGYPLALHCYGPVVAHKIECAAQANGQPVEGLVYVSSGTGDPRSEGKGLVLFYPLEPWLSGAQRQGAVVLERQRARAAPRVGGDLHSALSRYAAASRRV